MCRLSIPAILEKGWEFAGIGPLPTFWLLWLALELSWHCVCHSLRVCYNGSHWSAILDPFSSNQFMLCPRAVSFFLSMKVKHTDQEFFKTFDPLFECFLHEDS